MSIQLYVLNDKHEVVPEPSVRAFGEFFEKIENRRVDWTELEGFTVSTIFLGIDHRVGDDKDEDSPPVVFETMVFPTGSWSDIYVDRCRTWDEAVEAHRKAVEKYR